MTPVLLPLVVSLAAVSIDAGSYRPAPAPLPGMTDLRQLSSAGPLTGAGIEPVAGSVIDGFAYPEAYHWTGSDIGSARSPMKTRSREPLAVAGASGRRPFSVTTAASPDDDFDVTTGAGLVGIGFRWRFR